MTLLVLKKPYIPNDHFQPWQSLGFVETSTEVDQAMRSVPFRRGDLFACVSPEHVSSIEKNLIWLGVAGSTKTIHTAPDNELIRRHLKTWILAYDDYGVRILFHLLPNPYDQTATLRILYRCVEEIMNEAVKGDPVIGKAMRVIGKYLFGNLSSEKIDELLESFEFIEEKNDFHQVVVNFCRAIDGNLETRTAIQDTIENMDYGIYGLGQSSESPLNEMAQRFRELIPLPMLILTHLENKPLKIK